MYSNFDRRVADSDTKTWVDRAPLALRPYLRLARYDRPIGFWLLAIPCWQGLMLARTGQGIGLVDLGLAVLFAVGAIAMRGAGCTYNDIVDRDLDAQVARTADRPIPAGSVTLKQAWLFLAGQLLAGALVLVFLPWQAILVALASLALVAAYPFMKRLTWWPQAWLGLTFNWGIPVAYVAATGQFDPAMLALYLAAVFWTLGYDTIYAHQDTEDDALVGVKSTARLFGENAQYWVAGFYGLNAILVGVAIWLAGASPFVVLPYAVYTFHLFNQVRRLDIEDSRGCLALFKSNRLTGLLLVLTLTVGTLPGG
ncbi:4-hydroxybenzoate octaprenyltransferase [Maricaulis sp. CAU 1757]